MQSTGQTSTQAVSLVPTQGSQMIYAIPLILLAAQAVMAPPACDAALAARFTPARPVLGRYEVCTVPAPLDTVLGGARAAGQHVAAVDALDPLDAFGTA